MKNFSANIFRTDPAQIEAFGEVAFSNMNFSDGSSRHLVRTYCEMLANNAGVIAPRIEVVVLAA